MMDWRSACLPGSATLHTAIATLDRSRAQIVLVVEDERLTGTVTDGDIRRGLLRSVSLDQPVSEVMNAAPQTILDDDGPSVALRRMRELRLHQMPVLDQHGKVVDLYLLDELIAVDGPGATVVLMAGGMGKRLRPLTETTPKPLLNVGGRPLIETIVRSLVIQGLTDIFLSVNYKADLFRDFFGDGSQHGANIRYLDEGEPRGTAGALSLLPDVIDRPLLVMNSDLLTTIDYRSLLRFHKESDAVATMCVREYAMEVPYGVIEVEGDRLTGIVEKPTQSFFINAGIYALSPKACQLIPDAGFFDMPTLFAELIKSKQNTAAFPIREYWLDIGRTEDLERAQGEYHGLFD